MPSDEIKEFLELLKEDICEATGCSKEDLFNNIDNNIDFVSSCVCAAREMERSYIEYYQEMYGVDIMKVCKELMGKDE